MADPSAAEGRGPRRWSALTSEEAGEAAERDPVLVLPLAATEQHGPHLPLSTDLDIGRGILESALRHLPDGFPLWILPEQGVGASREHAGFPGTLSLEAELLERVIVRIGRAAADAGARRLVLHNSHGGNRAAMDAAGLRLREEAGMLVVKSSWFAHPPPGGIEWPESEWRHGLHGGAAETAMMLHLRPESVRADRIAASPSLDRELEERLRRVTAEGAVSFSWLARDLHPSGAVGDPRLADAATGERLVDHYGKALAETLRDARRFPVERLV